MVMNISAMCSEYIEKLESKNQSFALCIISNSGPITLFIHFGSFLLCCRFSPNISADPLMSMHVSE